ncbi:MAG: tetratricopeptide repeat protein [Porticoccus sp.]|nr:tetratricopeptide repeat protein [Porticoccus sp.]
MAEHLSDEEQLENLKQWWKEHGLFTILAVLVSIGGYFGWGYWQEQRQQQLETASMLYQQMMEVSIVDPGQKANDTQHKLVNELAVQLKTEFSDSQYARYGALLVARLAVEKNDLDVAAEQLKWALDDADEGLGLIITLRLAKVEASRGNLDLAVSMLNGVDAKTMSSAYAEARGDFYLMKGDKSAAYEAYQQATKLASEQDNRLGPILQLKLNQVAPAVDAVENVNASGDDA